MKKILAARNDRFGELLLIVPALRALKEKFPQAAITLAVDPYCRELAQCMEFVDESLAWENRRHSFFEILSFVRKTRKEGFDLCVIFNPSKEFNIISFLARIPLRIGYDRKAAALLTHVMTDTKHLGEKHEIAYNLDLVGLAGAHTKNKGLSLRINSDIIIALFKELGIGKSNNLVALHPWTSDPAKQWPLDNFRELAARLTDECNLTVLVVGGIQEAERSRRYFDKAGGRLVNLTGRTSLTQLAALLAECRFLISGDSGPVHLAASVGRPVLALFRNDMPGKGPLRWGPQSAGSVVIEKPRLSDISVEEVMAKVRQMMGKP